jgi:hypothetical protein
MADAEDVRRLALALPHVEEIDCDGFDFRVGGKGFVWSYPERQPGQGRVLRTDIAVLFVGDEAEKQALLLGEPAMFFTTPGCCGWPRWTPGGWPNWSPTRGACVPRPSSPPTSTRPLISRRPAARNASPPR